MSDGILFDGELTWPPSVNHYWMQGKPIIKWVGKKQKKIIPRYKSPAANKFIADSKSVMTGINATSLQRIGVEIMAFPPDKRVRDIDNILKGILDVFVCCKVIGDDSQVDDIRIVRGDVKKGGLVKVKVFEL